MSRRVHLLGLGTSILDKAPLLCGQTRDTSTLVTTHAYLATCARCTRAHVLAREESEHQRTQTKLRRERGDEVSP